VQYKNISAKYVRINQSQGQKIYKKSLKIPKG